MLKALLLFALKRMNVNIWGNLKSTWSMHLSLDGLQYNAFMSVLNRFRIHIYWTGPISNCTGWWESNKLIGFVTKTLFSESKNWFILGYCRAHDLDALWGEFQCIVIVVNYLVICQWGCLHYIHLYIYINKYNLLDIPIFLPKCGATCMYYNRYIIISL